MTKLTFLGAARTVTGSKYLLEVDDKKILVDCGLFQGLKELRLRNWQPLPMQASEISAVVLTHAHLDHVLGVPSIAAETGAPVWLHPADRPLYDAVPDQAVWFGLAPPERLTAPDQDLAHGARLQVGGLSFEVRHAPGHSPGSVCLLGPGVVLSGDVLFAGSIGRTDLPGGDFETLIASIERELLPLPDDTILYSGHGPETTIGRERQTNPFLTGLYRIG